MLYYKPNHITEDSLTISCSLTANQTTNLSVIEQLCYRPKSGVPLGLQIICGLHSNRTLSVCPSVCRSVCLSVRPSVSRSVSLSVCLSVCLSVLVQSLTYYYCYFVVSLLQGRQNGDYIFQKPTVITNHRST